MATEHLQWLWIDELTGIPTDQEVNAILNCAIDNLIAREWVRISPYAVGAPNHRKLRLNRIRRLRRALA
jgi:hypothetical protein